MNINLQTNYKLINNNLLLKVENTKIGNIIIIDNFLKCPNIYSNFFKKNYKYSLSNNDENYPGSRFDLNYVLKKEFDLFINTYIKNFYFTQKSHIINSKYNLSITNKKNKELKFSNCLPHHHYLYLNNLFKTNGISLCLYLFNSNHKSYGTHFYKEKFNLSKIIKKKIYYINNKPIMNDDIFTKNNMYYIKVNYLKNILLNPKYNSDTKEYFYKKIYSTKAKFNRCVFFSRDMYHDIGVNHNYYNNYEDMYKDRFTITGNVAYNILTPITDNDHYYMNNFTSITPL